MADTIESFVAKLQADGVDAGRKQAETIQADAQAGADRILADAQKQAEKILADAEAEAGNLLARGKTELTLAARDTTLKLQDALSGAMQALVSEAVKGPIQDPTFLGKLLHEIVLMYVEQLQQSRGVMQINVPKEMREGLVEWALRELGRTAIDGVRGLFNLEAHLKTAGFEYSVTGATVEVTAESVTNALTELLTPRLREILDQATGEHLK